MLEIAVSRLIICSLLSIQPLSVSATLEQLNYPSDAKLLIIHADDAGMSHSVNEATLDAMQKGSVSSAAIMVPCPWFLEIAEFARQYPEMDFGLHLTLTSEWKHYRWRPVADPSKVPGLIDEEGYFWKSVEDVVGHATMEEVELEIRAQIDRALAFGINPSHIDSHMGTLFATSEFLSVYLKVAIEYGIPPMMLDPADPEVKKLLEERGISYSDSTIQEIYAAKVPLLNHLNTGEDGNTYQTRKAAYYQAIRDIKPGVNQIIVHLAGDDAEIQNITNAWQKRYDEFRIFTDPELKNLIEDLNIELIGWRKMKDIMPRQNR